MNERKETNLYAVRMRPGSVIITMLTGCGIGIKDGNIWFALPSIIISLVLIYLDKPFRENIMSSKPLFYIMLFFFFEFSIIPFVVIIIFGIHQNYLLILLFWSILPWSYLINKFYTAKSLEQLGWVVVNNLPKKGKNA